MPQATTQNSKLKIQNYGIHNSRYRQHSLDDCRNDIGAHDEHSGHSIVLRRTRPPEERAECDNADHAHCGRSVADMGGYRLLVGVRNGIQGERLMSVVLHGRTGQGVHARHNDPQHNAFGNTRNDVCHVPVYVRTHHSGAHTRCICRTNQVQGLHGVHHSVGHHCLSAYGPLGVGRRILAADGCHRLCRRHRGAHQRRRVGIHHVPHDRQARRLAQGTPYHATQHNVRVHGHVVPLARMVRIQCR